MGAIVIFDLFFARRCGLGFVLFFNEAVNNELFDLARDIPSLFKASLLRAKINRFGSHKLVQ